MVFVGKSISAFFPVYNDEATIELMVEKLKKVLSSATNDFEIVIVNDASPDKSGEIADNLAKKYPFVKVIHHEKNKGYGGALKTGFKNSTKELVFYTDGDAQYDVYELEKFFKYMNDFDVVTGTKIKRADAVYRLVVSKLYYGFIRFVFGLKVKDISGDFRLFKQNVVQNMNLKSNSGTICLELIKRIESQGFKIKEVPVNHYPRVSGDSQYFNLTDILKTWMELVPLWGELVAKKALKNMFKFGK